eukprot:365520-Chlamydomonas_euryale.AAC.5
MLPGPFEHSRRTRAALLRQLHGSFIASLGRPRKQCKLHPLAQPSRPHKAKPAAAATETRHQDHAWCTAGSKAPVERQARRSVMPADSLRARTPQPRTLARTGRDMPTWGVPACPNRFGQPEGRKVVADRSVNGRTARPSTVPACLATIVRARAAGFRA